MDSLTASAPEIIPAPAPAPVVASPTPAMPREAPLAMPVQSLRQFSRSERRAWVDPTRARTPWLERLFVFGGALALTGLWRAGNVRRRRGRRDHAAGMGAGRAVRPDVLLDLPRLHVRACSGFAWLVFRAPRSKPLPRTLNVKTAIVMPIYNEAAGAGVRGDAGDLRGHRGDGPGRRLRLFLSLRHHQSRHLDRRGAGAAGDARAISRARVYSIADDERT